jgi:hypothetical protein
MRPASSGNINRLVYFVVVITERGSEIVTLSLMTRQAVPTKSSPEKQQQDVLRYHQPRLRATQSVSRADFGNCSLQPPIRAEISLLTRFSRAGEPRCQTPVLQVTGPSALRSGLGIFRSMYELVRREPS